LLHFCGAGKSGFQNLPYTTLTKIESNVITKPSIQKAVKIAKYLEIKIDELIK